MSSRAPWARPASSSTPLGALTMEAAVEAFTEQARGLAAGGADVAWIETMSAGRNSRPPRAAQSPPDLPYVLHGELRHGRAHHDGPHARGPGGIGRDARRKPVAYGANCGIGPGDLVASMLAMSGAAPSDLFVAKGNCGIPKWAATHVQYGGTPELMAEYAASRATPAPGSSAAAAAPRPRISQRCARPSISCSAPTSHLRGSRGKPWPDRAQQDRRNPRPHRPSGARNRLSCYG